MLWQVKLYRAVGRGSLPVRTLTFQPGRREQLVKELMAFLDILEEHAALQQRETPAAIHLTFGGNPPTLPGLTP